MKEEITAEKAHGPANRHHLTIYQNVLARLYNALPSEIKKWDAMADQLNTGTGSGEMKAMYVISSVDMFIQKVTPILGMVIWSSRTLHQQYWNLLSNGLMQI